MKLLQSSFFRALCCIIIGGLMINNTTQTSQWIVTTIGCLFFVSGVISYAGYYASKNKNTSVELFDANGNKINSTASSFPIVGIGSMVLGGLLALMPQTFIKGLNYVIAIILIIGSINQFINLSNVKKIAKIGAFFWIIPCITLLIGLATIIKPTLFSDLLVLIISWALLVYGVSEAINAFHIYRIKKSYTSYKEVKDTTDSADKEAQE